MSKLVSYVDSTQYYDINASDYARSTKDVDLSFLYDLFLPHLPKGAKILDAGCGSGRDTKHFLTQGFEVDAFDGAPKMTSYASELTGIEVKNRKFEDVNETEEYNGIWTSASLLHVKKESLPSVLRKLYNALKPGGYWYLSFREGESEVNEKDRYFNDQTKGSLRSLLQEFNNLIIVELMTPKQLRSRRGFKFVVAVVRKSKH